MTLLNAISLADTLRPNPIAASVKADIIIELETELCEKLGEDPPVNSYPSDMTLKADANRGLLYVYYLMARIDLLNQDSELYEQDAPAAEQAVKEALAAHRRAHKPGKEQRWQL